MMELLVDIYRSKKHEGMYLYVKKGAELTELPEELNKRFGIAEYALGLVVNEHKKLAQADAQQVITSIQEQGFYLQLPPRADSYMQQIPNDKLSAQ